MSYDAVVCNVMIASPNDVFRERQLAQKVVWHWNYIHSNRTRIVLIPVDWESHSFPSMGDRPQSIINKQVLERSDLLIGVFWTRLGTPTGEADSGTVEEIEKHVSNGKPAMLYFSSAPVKHDSVDDEQYERLKAFKQKCKNNGLIVDYDHPDQFAERLKEHLVRMVDDNAYFQSLRQGLKLEATSLPIAADVTEVPLSKEASILLHEAASDRNGMILKVRTSGGLTVQTNNKNLVTEPNNPRCEATWDAAVDNLVEFEFIVEAGQRGETFRVTRAGYEYAERTRSSK